MSVTAIEIRRRLFSPARAVADRPLIMRNGFPVPQHHQQNYPPPRAALSPEELHQRCVIFFNACIAAKPPAQRRPATVDDIIKFVAKQHRFTVTELISERRTRNLVRPRQVAMWLCKTLTTRSLPYIGSRMNGKDHTTVLHGFRKIEMLRQLDPELQAQLDQFLSALRPPPENDNAEASPSP